MLSYVFEGIIHEFERKRMSARTGNEPGHSASWDSLLAAVNRKSCLSEAGAEPGLAPLGHSGFGSQQ